MEIGFRYRHPTTFIVITDLVYNPRVLAWHSPNWLQFISEPSDTFVTFMQSLECLEFYERLDAPVLPGREDVHYGYVI